MTEHAVLITELFWCKSQRSG